MASTKKVVILGAGIIGLQCALTLLDAGYNVHMIAEIWPEDVALASIAIPTISNEEVKKVRTWYASAWAGAQWRTHEKSADARAAKWDEVTYKAWMQLVMLEKDCGVTKVEARNYWDSPDAEFPPWWSKKVEAFASIASSSLPKGANYGATYTSFAINPPVHLPWLVEQIKTRGGLLTRAKISTDSGLESAIDQVAKLAGGEMLAIINATGLGAKQLSNDENMYPIRGQTVLVQGVLGTGGLLTRLGKKPGETVAIMPRAKQGVTVVGVTREENNWNVIEDTETTVRLVEGAGEVVDVADAKILRAQVGLRPARKGGARVEIERVGMEGSVVVHAYGHAGAGYQNSIGCAQEVLKLIQGLQ